MDSNYTPSPSDSDTPRRYEPESSETESSYDDDTDAEGIGFTDTSFPQRENLPHVAPWLYPPTFHELEEEGLSLTLSLNSEREDQADKGQSHEAWHQPKWNSSNTACSTEPLAIYALEYSVDGHGQDKITLVCPKGPPIEGEDSPSVQMRWL